MAAQIGYFDTLKSVVGKVFAYLASITITGTDGKTITCTQDTSLDESVAMSSKAPKVSPVFTGTVTAPKAKSVSGSTLLDNNTVTTLFTISGEGLHLIVAYFAATNDMNAYSASALVACSSQANYAKIHSQHDGANMFLTLFEDEIRCKQTSGIQYLVYYVDLLIGV